MRPDWEDFGRRILERWQEGDMEVDMMDVQDWAEAAGIIKRVPGGFDPGIHIDLLGCAEPGDDWFKIA